MNYNTEYKNEITGLRGISVLLVILFHINEEIFFFGFLGVDIFFVISGYVITLTLHKEYSKDKKIKILSFYLRRIKRLFPSLICCIFFTYFVYMFVADLIYFKEITKSAITSIFGFSNLYYIISNQNYFINSIENPFIHTWSLGIEEQYYLIYPFFLLLIYLLNRFFKFSFFSLIFFFTSILFFFTLVQFRFFDNFYFPLSRFWEISLGCLLFFLKKTKIKLYLQNFFLFFQIIFSITLLYFIEYDVQKIILINNLLVFSIIYYDKNFFNILLKNNFIIYLGKISYSIYLFHFPIIVFCLIFFEGYLFYTIAIMLIFAISFLNYHFVETRFKNMKSNPSIYKYVSIVLLFFILFFMYSFYVDNKKLKSSVNNILYNIEGFAYKYNINNKNNYKFLNNSTNIENYRFKNIDLRQCSSQRVMPKEFYYENCFIDNKKDVLIQLVGDSQAEHLVPMLLENKNEFNYLITPMIGATFFPYSTYEYNNESMDHKTKINSHYMKMISQITNDDYISYKKRILVIAGRPGFALNNFKFIDSNNSIINIDDLNSYIHENFENFINTNSENTNFILIPDIPVAPFTLSDCVENITKPNSHIDFCTFNINKFINERSTINKIYLKLSNQYDNVSIFDFVNYNCDSNVCKYFYDDFKPIYSRKNHFNIEYSKEMSLIFYKFIRNIN